MSLVVEIQVNPSSGRQKITLNANGILKLYLKSPPIKGKANAELIKFLSKALHLPKEKVTIIHGATSRKKRIKIDCDLTFNQFCEQLELEKQEVIF